MPKNKEIAKIDTCSMHFDFKMFWIDWFTQWLGTQNPGDIGQYLSFAQKQRFETNGFHSFYFTHMAFSYMYVLTSYIGVASFYFNITSSHVIGYLMHMSLFL